MTGRRTVRGFRGRVASRAALARSLRVRPRKAVVLVGLTLLYAVFEGFGVGSLLPILQFIESGLPARPNVYWRAVTAICATVGVAPSFAILLLLAVVPIGLRQLFMYVRTAYAADIQRDASARLRSETLTSFIEADFGFHLAAGHGRLVNALTLDAQRASNGLLHATELLAAAALIAVYVALLVLVSPPLTGLVTGLLILSGVVIRGKFPTARALGKAVSELNNAYTAIVDEKLSGIRLVRMSGQEQVEARKGSLVSAGLAARIALIVRNQASMEALVELLLIFGTFLILFLAVEALGLTLASLALFSFVILRLMPVIRRANGSAHQLAALAGSLGSIEQLIRDANRARQSPGGRRPFEGVREAIAFDGVTFSYPTGAVPALREVSLTIPARRTTALVGPSGAGKSTLMDLIPRLYEPMRGRVLIDGVPVQEYDVVSLRRKIGFVSQDTVLFRDTIRNNLTFGLDGCSDAAVSEALARAGLQEFVDSLPDRCETMIADRGLRLSGGQRQRLALARVFLQDPDVLILDEPTSALDALSEEHVSRTLRQMHGSKTIVVIAHRLATIEHADQIAVMADGMVTTVGDHRTALARDPLYARLFAGEQALSGATEPRRL
ncbi:MAG: ABC transporter ATP-binding protein [Candidatus Rokubacteria bacterium]|nr:ABC transporter ATP-binding protein [Candidatus Rokubacteria bacterium]